ncbi:hypothetical protein JMG10_24405 [Nostoc ellipsosporum NOK]|nr:hypothetical protein [Nostoc ellipsosporum NOK]
MAGTIALALLVLPFAQGAEARPERLKGPLAICFNYSSFDLPAGQMLDDFKAGTETMRARVKGRGAGYEIVESELWGMPADRGTLVATYGDTHVYRLGDGRGTAYAVDGPARFFRGEERRIVRLQGRVFTGDARDAAIYSRFRIVDPATAPCKHRFVYGWDAMSWDAAEAGDRPAPNHGRAAAAKASW